ILYLQMTKAVKMELNFIPIRLMKEKSLFLKLTKRPAIEQTDSPLVRDEVPPTEGMPTAEEGSKMKNKD
ncbi:MAG TPA: hypothetical protein VKA92_09000, partial [Segetibacter sp.]|nr:hypothetical protein [Segetibacter sp.]